MRDTSQRKAETRQRIMDAASALFRAEGIDGVGVDAIMRAAGLTHGGFYLHFASKEALVAAVAADQLASSAARWTEAGTRLEPAEALRRIVGGYLDSTHLEPDRLGCVLPALGPELARRAEARSAITGSMHTMIAALARLLTAAPASVPAAPASVPAAAAAEEAEAEAEEASGMATLSTLVGAVVLARLSSDPALSQAILAAARQHILAG